MCDRETRKRVLRWNGHIERRKYLYLNSIFLQFLEIALDVLNIYARLLRNMLLTKLFT